MVRRTMSTGSTGPQDRLPVNPRRQKVSPENRKRVALACNSCNIRRVKCSGERPCNQCANAHPPRECQYPVIVEKVSIPKAEFEELRARCATLQRLVETCIPGAGNEHVQTRGSVPSEASYAATPQILSDDDSVSLLSWSTRPQQREQQLLWPERNDDGQLGEPGSIQSIFDRLRQLLDPAADISGLCRGSVSSLGSSDPRLHADALFAESATETLQIPSFEEVTARLANMQHYVHDSTAGNRSGGIWYWLPRSMSYRENTLFERQPTSAAATAKMRHDALYQIVMAASHDLSEAGPESLSGGWDSGSCSTGLTLSNKVLLYLLQGSEITGHGLQVTAFSSFEDASMLALMAAYLAECGRAHDAYLHISTALHVCLAQASRRDWLLAEEDKRAVWTIFAFDRHLACLLGRTPSIRADAIHLHPPADVLGMPSIAGLRANVELARLVEPILRDSCQTRQPTAPQLTSRMERALASLSNWLTTLSPNLRLDLHQQLGGHSYERGTMTLHLLYHHLVIVAIIPAFLTMVGEGTGAVDGHVHSVFFERLVKSARATVTLTRELVIIGQRLTAIEQHQVFIAAAVIVLYNIQSGYKDDDADVMYVVGLLSSSSQPSVVVNSSPPTCAAPAAPQRNNIGTSAAQYSTILTNGLIGAQMALLRSDQQHRIQVSSTDFNTPPPFPSPNVLSDSLAVAAPSMLEVPTLASSAASSMNINSTTAAYYQVATSPELSLRLSLPTTVGSWITPSSIGVNSVSSTQQGHMGLNAPMRMDSGDGMMDFLF